MCLCEAVEPVCCEMCSASCVFNAALAWTGAVESTSCPGGDRAFESQAKRTTMFLKTIELDVLVCSLPSNIKNSLLLRLAKISMLR